MILYRLGARVDKARLLLEHPDGRLNNFEMGAPKSNQNGEIHEHQPWKILTILIAGPTIQLKDIRTSAPSEKILRRLFFAF